MSTLSIQPSYPIFTEANGQPLEDGYIWIGAANLDPQVNPIAVYWDKALTAPASQPIRTLDGYPSNSGTPGRLYVTGNYSIRVMSKKGSVVYSSPDATEIYNGAVVNFSNVLASGDGAQILFPLQSQPVAVYIDGVYQNRGTYTYGVGGVLFSEAPPSNTSIEFLI